MFKRWLSKNERETLTREERKDLRKERRKAAKEAGELWYQKVFDVFEGDHGIIFKRDRLDDLIIEAIKEVDEIDPNTDRYEKINLIIDIVVDQVDDLVDFSGVVFKVGPFPIQVGAILEKYDAPLLSFALKGLITDAVLARLQDPDSKASL